MVKPQISALIASLVFGVGLPVSGIANPEKALVSVASILAGTGLFKLIERNRRA
ncbi:hypothetical protein [Aquisalimonas sp.]|uniref:hypothetical protein n=1 Tax=Aquisalimonas sp. TaxID=1872621 RepID=UPI0025BCDE5F|nr:hypothetical protein [Aquisalimonas sp.]